MSSHDSKGEPGFVLGKGSDGRGELPRIDFSTFVLSLGTSALLHLGLAPDLSDQAGGSVQVDLPLARQAIDTLEMIDEKTRGNLDEEESKLLRSVLYELRMKFVQIEKDA
jgi:hypothetical protein